MLFVMIVEKSGTGISDKEDMKIGRKDYHD